MKHMVHAFPARKFILLFLLLSMLLSLTLPLTACDLSGQNAESKRGSRELESWLEDYKAGLEYVTDESGEHVHSFSSWVCDPKDSHIIQRICACGLIEDKEKNHVFGEWSILQDASCERSGSKVRTCPFCGEAEHANIPISHQFENGFCALCGIPRPSEGLNIFPPNSDNALLNGRGSCKDVDIVIPNNVTRIGYRAFYPYDPSGEGKLPMPDITSVYIPDSVLSIEADAFYGCSHLSSVRMSESLTSIGSCAFAECGSLTGLTIPDSVVSIGESALGSPDKLDCTSHAGGLYFGNPDNPYLVFMYAADREMTECTIHKKTRFIYSDAFSHCTNLTSVTIPEGVTQIGKYAFYECTNLTSITIPEGVTEIGAYAFSGCTNLTSISLPQSLEHLMTNVFGTEGYGTEDENLKFMTYDNALYLGNQNNPYLVLVKAVNRDITTCTIHENTSLVASQAFADCEKLTSVTISEGVSRLDRCAFENCTGLTSITIPKSMTVIGSLAFAKCRNLTSVTIPEGVTVIEDFAFEGCPKLTINCAASKQPSGWSFCWNMLSTGSYKTYPVNWGVKGNE